MNFEYVVRAIKVFARNIHKEKEELIQELAVEFGSEAKKVFYLMPIAFGWVVLGRLGATQFPVYVEALNGQLNVRDDEFFSGFARFANDQLINSFNLVDKQEFESVLYYGAEGKIALQLFKDNANAEGAVIAQPLIDDEL